MFYESTYFNKKSLYIILFYKPNTMNSPRSDSSAHGSTASAVIPYRPVVFVLLSPTTIKMVFFAPGDDFSVDMRPGIGMIDRCIKLDNSL